MKVIKKWVKNKNGGNLSYYFWSYLIILVLLSFLGNLCALGIEASQYQTISKEEFRNFQISATCIKRYKKLGRVGCAMFEKKYEPKYGTKAASIIEDMECFPVLEKSEVVYEDSWMNARTYGGKRVHEGTDIMAKKNKRGELSIVSVSDGVVEKIGWLPLGGYRIGVRSNHGVYFYYAHLYSYAKGIEEGAKVHVGQLLGKMGDSGYGEEGTVGKFPVHLHFGIYVSIENEEKSVNPYQMLNYWK